MTDRNRIKTKRDEFRKTFTGVLYNSYLNLFLVCLVFIASLTYSGLQITWNLTTLVLLIVGFFYSDGMFYLAHRFQQHRKIRTQEWAFTMHSFWHHGMFSTDEMHVTSFKDLNMIILPFFIHGFVLGCTYLPAAWLMERYLSIELGWIFMFAAATHLLWYEIIHTLAHRESVPVFKTLAQHHQAHHNPALMGKYNFGIATTIFDRVFNTLHRH